MSELSNPRRVDDKNGTPAADQNAGGGGNSNPIDDANPPLDGDKKPADPASAPKLEETVEFWKQKHGDSSREAQVLQGKLDDREKRKLQEPTDAEMKQSYPSWEEMAESEKITAKNALHARRVSEVTQRNIQNLSGRQGRDAEITRVAASNPKIRDNEAAFRIYCNKPTHRDAPVDVLVKAFASDLPTPPPPKPEDDKDEKKDKSKHPVGLEGGGAGGAGSSKPKEISDEEADHILKKEPKKARDLIKSGKL